MIMTLSREDYALFPARDKRSAIDTYVGLQTLHSELKILSILW